MKTSQKLKRANIAFLPLAVNLIFVLFIRDCAVIDNIKID
jgi:hypothetical protein